MIRFSQATIRTETKSKFGFPYIDHTVATPMSRASKITFTLSCLFTAVTVVGVHIVQDLERETLHQGPIKDAERTAARKQQQLQQQAADGVAVDPAKERQKLANRSEHELQQELRKNYEAMQPLSGQVVTKDGEVVHDKSR